VFVDVIPVSAVLYIINFANCYQNGPQKARKEVKEGREGKESNRCIHLPNDNVMSYYRTVLKKKQKQTTLDQFLVPKRLKPSDPEAGPSGLQTLPRRERTPESQLLFLVGFLWEFRNAL